MPISVNWYADTGDIELGPCTSYLENSLLEKGANRGEIAEVSVLLPIMGNNLNSCAGMKIINLNPYLLIKTHIKANSKQDFFEIIYSKKRLISVQKYIAKLNETAAYFLPKT